MAPSTTKPGENMLWGGRFTGGLDPLMVAYNESIHFDKALYKQDILGSIAFARANTKGGILTQDEFNKIEAGLREVMAEWEAGKFVIVPGVDEDIHTANERRLGEIIGKDVAGKLHTGRSRNEQVVCDMRMWLRDELRKIEEHLVVFLRVAAERAEREVDHVMPGYTHLQRAQPIRWSHWIMSYCVAFAADLERLREVIKRVNKSPLGCGALAGNPFNIDREMMAEELGFEGLLWNSMGGVADRDFVAEPLQWGSMLMLHISRWAEDLIIYSTAEFGFVRLADAYSTGSSLMPQKKNPDSLELLRGKSGRILGQMTGFMTTIKGLPSTYNKDLQESWEVMLDSVKTVSDSIQIATGVLATLDIQPAKMRAALDPFMLATDIADYLVRKGVPFRETHHTSGRVVALSEQTGTPMDKLTYEQLKGIDSRFEPDIADYFDYDRSVEMRSAKGGTSKESVLEQIRVIKETLGA
ncbi:L-Aspartase-like protein [Microdochium trichocladiopsis]|uniref:argininosuccinate lyase n=1 Tax=Microdochium trichocladiopsis TaxID=1682393 RepID=A0A9P8YHV4_9PEZI|nr:L-Aspartase-like protein [Microdochium trichocladiopsis]KAH7040565.1 L-Aspartase-like protein [Microdochium trichocladiopsis]